MRFVPIQSVKENSILGKRVYSEDGRILLQQGVKLTPKYIQRLQDKKINGVYIDSDVSKNIEIVNVISDRLRNKAVQDVKETFTLSETSPKSKKRQKKLNYKNINHAVDNIVDEIIDNKHMLLNLVDLKLFDDYTFHHSVNVAVISITIGIALNMDKKRLFKLGLAGILHDIGKTFVPENVLNKQGKLDDREWHTIKRHSELGYKHLKENYPNIPATSLAGILQHHEKWNGKGYPDGRKGEEIFEFGQIIAIADVYDALTSNRPYRDAMHPHEALEYIMGMGDEHFSLEIVKKFTEKIAPYPLGTIVKLSDDTKGIVVENNVGFGLRPVLKIFKDKNDELIDESDQKIINLKENIDLTIIDVLAI